MSQPITQMLNVRSVYKSIETFLKSKEADSINTRKAYEKDIRRFFRVMIGKEINELEPTDLGFLQEDILRYRDYLMSITKDNGESYSAASINRFIESVRSLFDFLMKNRYRDYIDPDAFHFDNLKNIKRSKTGRITEQEFRLYEEKALGLQNGYMKSMLIGLAGRTSFRLNAILSLTWSDFSKINSNMYLVKTIDKGKKEDEKPILNVFYH